MAALGFKFSSEAIRDPCTSIDVNLRGQGLVMPTNNCPHCSVQVALLDDGTCPVCGQNALEAVERSLPAQKADSELQPVDQQDPEIEACLVDDELGVEAQPLPPSPKFGFFGAVGWCLVLLLIQISLGCVLGVVLVATGSNGRPGSPACRLSGGW